MHKTIYIDIDEEITSIVDRVKMEQSDTIVLVVPKNAMLTEGIINLKLLKKEVDRLGKSLTIATNDKHARKVIERVEIKTQEAKGDLGGSEEPPEKEQVISKKASDEAVNLLEEDSPVQNSLMDEVGSSDFFTEEEIEDEKEEEKEDEFEKQSQKEMAKEELSSELQKKKETVPVSNAPEEEKGVSSDKLHEADAPNVFVSQDLKESLYSKKTETEAPKKMQKEDVQNAPKPKQPIFSGPVSSDVKRPQMDMAPRQVNMSMKKESPSGESKKDLFGNVPKIEQKKQESKKAFDKSSVSKKAEQFFSRKEEPRDDTKDEFPEISNQGEGAKKKSGRFWTLATGALLLVGVIAGIAGWVYVNYPKVNVTVYPQKQELSKEIKIVTKEDADSSMISEGILLGKYAELMVSKTMNFASTGETYESDDGKARGKVTIMNKYSSSVQPLIKTTRLLSKEGKLFRIVEDVEVPGMDGDEPGEIEVAVIADQPGQDFNIGPSKFTIEGFKGNPKYEGFEVVSKIAMTEGGSPDSNKKMAMVTESDINKARAATIEELETALEAEIQAQLDDGQKVLVDSVEKEIESSSSSHKASAVAKTFSYTVNQKVKAIIFSAEDVNALVMQELEENVQEGSVMEGVSEVTFKKGIADYENKSLTMYVDAEAVSWPALNAPEIATGVAGKNEEEIRSFLAGYPNIEKVEITITPSWLTTVPVSEDKIVVSESRE